MSTSNRERVSGFIFSLIAICLSVGALNTCFCRILLLQIGFPPIRWTTLIPVFYSLVAIILVIIAFTKPKRNKIPFVLGGIAIPVSIIAIIISFYQYKRDGLVFGYGNDPNAALNEFIQNYERTGKDSASPSHSDSAFIYFDFDSTDSK